jgi:hypothetical protein
MSKVVALGGKHKSVQSLLAEMMGDDEIQSCVVMGFTKDGNTKFAHFEVTRKEMAFAACIFQHHAIEGDDE